MLICNQCASMPGCPAEVRGPYGRACWLAFLRGEPWPDCAQFVDRGECYWGDRREWERARYGRGGG